MVRRVVTPLPRWEQTTYWVVGLAAILYGVYNVYLASAGELRLSSLIHLFIPYIHEPHSNKVIIKRSFSQLSMIPLVHASSDNPMYTYQWNHNYTHCVNF